MRKGRKRMGSMAQDVLPYGTTKVTGKYQLTLPREVRDRVNVHLGDDILVRAVSPDRIELVILPPASPPCELSGSLRVGSDVKEELRGRDEDLTEGIEDYVAGSTRGAERR